MLKVKEIAFVCYPVTDLARARAFYEGVLNLKSTAEFGADGKLWIEYDIGPGTLAITNMTPEWRPSPEGGAAALEVEDFEEAIRAVRAAGTKILFEPVESPGCFFCVVLDPDGNSLALHHRKAS